MTDITDQDRRDAREWADEMSGHPILNENARAAVRYVLATVDAPAPTLADELLTPDGRNEDVDGDLMIFSVEKMETLAARAKQVEHDLAEARAEVERLDAERDEARNNEATESMRQQAEAWSEVWHHPVMKATDPGEGPALSRALRVLDSLHAAAECLDRNPETKARVEAALNNLDNAERVTVQKGAESNAETPDPADVKPGEAWAANIWYDDERHPGTAIKTPGGDWTVCRADGTRSTYRMNEYIDLIAPLVPAPRVITNPDELDTLPHNSVILSADNDAWQKSSEISLWASAWWATSDGEPSMWASGRLCDEDHPVTVLWEPEA